MLASCSTRRLALASVASLVRQAPPLRLSYSLYEGKAASETRAATSKTSFKRGSRSIANPPSTSASTPTLSNSYCTASISAIDALSTAKLDLSEANDTIGQPPTSAHSELCPPLPIPQNSYSLSSTSTSTISNTSHSLHSSDLNITDSVSLNRTRLLAGHFISPSRRYHSLSSSSVLSSNGIMTSLPISEKGYHSKAPSVYTTRKLGAPNTLEHRIWIEKDGVPVSPFHDIPLYANEQQTVLNMVVEVPRWTNAKMEISKEDTLNPIKQDTKKGKLRFVRNCFPHKGYLWNYGAFPQTWEDPNAIHPETKAKGDNDPLDVCEIGELVGKPGEIKQVKILGVMALLDEEETDWKIIVIDVNDPLAPKLNDVEDVERHLPGLLRATNEWFRIYKIPDGKPENQFAFSGECKNRKYATDIVRECAEAWERLATGKTQPGDISLVNTTVQNSPHRSDPSKLNIPKNENLAPAPIDPSIDKWFYISGQSS